MIHIQREVNPDNWSETSLS